MRLTCRRCGADISGKRFWRARSTGLCPYCVRLVLERRFGLTQARLNAQAGREQAQVKGEVLA